MRVQDYGPAMSEAVCLKGAWALIEAGGRRELVPLCLLAAAEYAALERAGCVVEILEGDEVKQFYTHRRRPQ